MSAPPKFSIVTPTFNSRGTLGETIRSVSEQHFKDWEHIVVDGGSSDGTVDLLRSHAHLKWVSEKDQGHYHAMNKGIAMAQGAWILILNADDCLRPGALAAVATAIDRHSEWDALFGDVVFVDANGRTIYLRREAGYDYKVLLYGLDYICHQTLFVRKAIYNRIGDYRHKEFLNAADYEFKLRVGRAGCHIGHVPELLVNYRYHDQGQSADKRIIRNMIAEAAAIRREHGHPGGWRTGPLRVIFKARRQAQKLLRRGTCDLIPGTWRLRTHLREETGFSSNAGLDKLER